MRSDLLPNARGVHGRQQANDKVRPLRIGFNQFGRSKHAIHTTTLDQITSSCLFKLILKQLVAQRITEAVQIFSLSQQQLIQQHVRHSLHNLVGL